MRGNDLLRDIGYISDDLIEEAMEDSGSLKIRYHWQKWGSIAACAAVLGISAAVIWIHSNRQLEEINLKNESCQENMISQEDVAFQENMAVTDMAAAEDTVTEAASDNIIQQSSNNTALDSVVRDEAANSNSEKKQDITDNAANFSKNDTDNYLNFESAEYTLIEDFPPKQMAPADSAEIEESIFCYKMPDKGEYFYYQRLKNAMEYYCEQDLVDTTLYAFQVAVDIFGDQMVHEEEQKGQNEESRLVYNILSQSDDGKQLLVQEYQRLGAEGYQVQLSEDYVLTGIFTKEELDNFQAMPQYGYVFRFENE